LTPRGRGGGIGVLQHLGDKWAVGGLLLEERRDEVVERGTVSLLEPWGRLRKLADDP